jgi:hypothetical protein
MRVVFSILVSILAASVAVAAVPGPDSLGLWFDEDYAVNEIDALPGPLACYLVLHEPTADQIASMSLRLDWPGSLVYYLELGWMGDPTVTQGYQCTRLDWSTPLPTQDATPLAEITLLVVQVAGERTIRARPCSDRPCIQYVAAGAADPTCLDTVLGDGILARLAVPVASEPTSWTAIKRLVR